MPRSSNALAKELRSIRTSFRQIATSFSRMARILTVTPNRSKGNVGEKRPRKKPPFSRAFWAHLKLQGKYMGTMRGLPASQRGKVKKIRAAKGIRAAIRAAQKLSGA